MPHRCPPHPARRHLLAKESAPVRAARKAFVRRFVAILRAWHGDILTALREGNLRLATDLAARRAIAAVLEQYRGDIISAYQTLYLETGAASRGVAARRYDLDIDPALPDRLARRLRELAADGASAVGDRMTEDIAQALRDAHDEGLAIPEIERVLEDTFEEMRGYEAERAARTEGVTAANRSAMRSYKDGGAVGKEWLAVDDHRTRMTHREMDGKTVPIDAPFTLDGTLTQYPGSPVLPIHERVNCRCSLSPVWEL